VKPLPRQYATTLSARAAQCDLEAKKTERCRQRLALYRFGELRDNSDENLTAFLPFIKAFYLGLFNADCCRFCLYFY